MVRPSRVCISIAVALIVAWAPLAARAAGPEIYVVYCGKNKQLKRAVTQALGDGVKAKTYNVDLLGLADYSGVQKAARKLSTARIVAFLGEGSLSPLAGSTLTSDVVVVGTTSNGVKAGGRVQYLLAAGSDTSGLDGGLRTIEASAAADLVGADADVVIVAEGTLDLPNALAAVVRARLGR